MTLKDRAGVLEVLFGAGFGGGEARKRVVEQGDDSLLFGERGECKCPTQNLLSRDSRNCSSGKATESDRKLN